MAKNFYFKFILKSSVLIWIINKNLKFKNHNKLNFKNIFLN